MQRFVVDCITMTCKCQSRLRAFLLAAIVAAGAAAHAQADTILSETVGNLTWKYTVTNGAARVYGGFMTTAIGWTSGEVVIPDTLGGLTVKAIGSYAFYQLGEMTSVKMPASVESIEFYAFKGCTNLVAATLSSNLTTLGNAVFGDCENLEEGRIPDSVTSMGRGMFGGCKSMRSVRFSTHAGSLDAMTCYNCDSLTEVTIPDCVTNIGVSAFLSCDNLRSVSLPKGDVTLGNYAFNKCPSLEVVDVSSGFIDFGNVFDDCPSLATVRIRQGVERVDPASFVGCKTMTNFVVEAGNAVYQSVDGVLYDITGKELVAWPAALRPVVIPDGVERVGDYAFGWTSDRTVADIPEGVEVSALAFATPPDEPEEPSDPGTHIEPDPDAPNGSTIYRNCFRIVPGQLPHLACIVSGLEGIDYAVDKFATNDWRVVIHGYDMNDSRIRIAPEGEHYVDDSNMPAGVYEVTGTSQPFVFEFCNWYKNGALGSKTWYGYVSIALDENAELVILESAICNQQNALKVVGPGESQGGEWINPDTGCETNTFYATSERTPHVLHSSDSAFDFVIYNYEESCWGVSINHPSGRGYVATVPAGTYINDSIFSQQRTSDGYDSGDLFFLAFKWWPDANDTTRHVRYGWLAIGLTDGAPAVLASEMSETAGAPLAARGFEGVDDGPDEPVDGLLWRCNFNNGVQWMDATNMPEVASHVLLAGDSIEALIDDGRYSGRRCVEIGGRNGERAWFSVNERVNGGLGPRYVPAKWQTLKTSFKMYSIRAWEELDGGLYADIPPSSEEEGAKGIKIVAVPGGLINIDDKLALRYCEREDELGYDMDYWWEVNAGMTNGVGALETRTVRLVEKERGDEPTSPVKNWVSIEIEAVNDGSPHGLAYRIYIDGVLVCSEEDGGSVFRARPVAADKGGVTALGIGGEAFIDDVVFSCTTIDPLSGVRIYPQRFGSGNVELTDDELANLADIIGFEALSKAERITMYPWEDDSGAEPDDAAKVCIDLGISPYHIKPDDGRDLTLFFKYPTVRAVGIDPASRTVTGQIVPAEGTRIVQPPLRFMFGIKHYLDFGTPYAHAEEYGYDIYWHPDKFPLDTSSYTTSNGLFTVTYGEKFSDEGSAFFSLSIKDFRY